MSSSKWVNRNLRAGQPQRELPDAMPSYRREFGRHHKSSRLFNDNPSRSHRRHNPSANQIFIVAILLVCLVTAVALYIYSRPRSATAAEPSGWEKTAARLFAPDSGPEPIPHDPVEIVDRFLLCTTKDQLTAICRDDDNSAYLLQKYGSAILAWLENHREWIPGYESKSNGILYSTFVVNHRSEPSRIIYVVQTPAGAKVDLGAFLGWCSEDWSNLTSGRATSASIVRAIATRANYYNYSYSNDKDWDSYALSPLDGSTVIYGYARRGTPTAKALERLVSGYQGFLVTVSLDDGERDSTNRQFRISRVLAAGWALGPEIFEDFIPQLGDNPANAAPFIPGASSAPDSPYQDY